MPNPPLSLVRHAGILMAALAMTAQCLAVDPPPPEILRASPAEQLRYAKKAGAESERSRAKVAKQRFEDKREVKQAFAAGLQREVDTQRETLAIEAGQAGSDLGSAATEVVGKKFFYLSITVLGLLIAYQQRERLFSWFEKEDKI